MRDYKIGVAVETFVQYLRAVLGRAGDGSFQVLLIRLLEKSRQTLQNVDIILHNHQCVEKRSYLGFK